MEIVVLGLVSSICNNFSGHVLELHVGNPFNNMTTDDAYERSRLVGKVNLSLLDLKHLNHLDLSFNNFEGSHIPRFLGHLRSLRYLNLHNAGFAGMIPHQLGNLSSLLHLDLGENGLEIGGLYVDDYSWLSGLYSLQYLDLSRVNLSKASDWLLVTNELPSLVVLQLSGCKLPNFFPVSIANCSSLISTLDLSINQFDTTFLRWFFSLRHLVLLDLSLNNFQGPIPKGFQNLTTLRHLSLYRNNFNSSIPNWLYGFSSLEYLDLARNSLQGTISDALVNMTSIEEFDLSFNRLEWKIPNSLGSLCNLRSISLSGVKLGQDVSQIINISSGCFLNALELHRSQIFGHLSTQLLQFKNLNFLDLSENSISGPIPSFLGELSSLDA